jgi:hypothetical protein
VEVVIRDYLPDDARQIIDIYRDSFTTLKKSKGGGHPDGKVDKIIQKPDKYLLKKLVSDGILVVAQVKGTHEIVGIGAISNTFTSGFLGSRYSRSHYVKASFQKGKAGVNVGTMLRVATIEKAKTLGARKLFGYSTNESVEFHKKFGARFVPRYNCTYLGGIPTNYYEIVLRKSIWNNIPFEPVLFHLSKIFRIPFFGVLGGY